MTFTSNKSMEIEVLVDADPVVDNSQKRYRAASAFFTYVSLNQEGKPMPVPQLVVSALMVTSCPKQGRTQAWDQGLCSGIVKSLESSLASCRLSHRWPLGI
jgi:acyl-CoA hydrolase